MKQRSSLFTYWVAMVLVCGQMMPLAQAQNDLSNSLDLEDVSRAIYHYEQFQDLIKNEGLDVALSHAPWIKHPDKAKKIFQGIGPLPELSLTSDHVLAQYNDGSIDRIPLIELQQGKLRIEGKILVLKDVHDFNDAFEKLRNPERVSLWKRFSTPVLEFMVTNAWATALSTTRNFVVNAIFAAILSAYKHPQKFRAQSAVESAIKNNLPLGPETLYGESRAPAYSMRGLSLVDRVRVLSGASVGGPDIADSRSLQKSTDDAISNMNHAFEGKEHCNSEFNKMVLENIPKIEKEVSRLGKSGAGHRNGGYSVSKGGFNVPVRIGGHLMSEGGKEFSHCSSATYTAFVKSLDSYLSKHQLSLSPAAASHFQTGQEDNFGAWGVWNNDFGGAGDVAYYLNKVSGTEGFSQTTDPALACPGDFVKFDRNKGTGHSVVFLGYQQSADGGKEFCYWSSNKGTEGYGVQCEKVERIQAYSVLKVNRPEVISQIRSGYSSKNSLVNGKNVYQRLYALHQNEALRAASDYHKRVAPEEVLSSKVSHE